jgi:hypothetical protein
MLEKNVDGFAYMLCHRRITLTDRILDEMLELSIPRHSLQRSQTLAAAHGDIAGVVREGG